MATSNRQATTVMPSRGGEITTKATHGHVNYELGALDALTVDVLSDLYDVSLGVVRDIDLTATRAVGDVYMDVFARAFSQFTMALTRRIGEHGKQLDTDACFRAMSVVFDQRASVTATSHAMFGPRFPDVADGRHSIQTRFEKPMYLIGMFLLIGTFRLEDSSGFLRKFPRHARDMLRGKKKGPSANLSPVAHSLISRGFPRGRMNSPSLFEADSIFLRRSRA
jgi:hypothetical protein